MTAQQQTSHDKLIAGVTHVSARRIGILADDHNSDEAGSDLPAAALQALAGVDLIVHLGHMGVREVTGRGVLDRLQEIAPVLGVRDYTTGEGGEPFITTAGKRIAGLTRVIEADGVRIGVVHNLEKSPGPSIVTPPGGLPDLANVAVPEVIQAKFGVPVDVVAYGGTHRAATLISSGILFVNPGSPTYPKGPGRTAGRPAPGTVGVLNVEAGAVAFEVLDVSLFTATAS